MTLLLLLLPLTIDGICNGTLTFVNDLHGGDRGLGRELVLFLHNGLIRLLLVALHRAFQLIQHIFAFLIAVQGSRH